MTKYLRIEQIIDYHDRLIEKYGGLHRIRDIGLLESALGMPKAAVFGQELHPTIYDKAAAYLFHIVKNHPFNDGNKRAGAFTACVFLSVNGVSVDFSDKKYEALVIEVAEGKADKEKIAKFFETSVK